MRIAQVEDEITVRGVLDTTRRLHFRQNYLFFTVANCGVAAGTLNDNDARCGE
jgi:hypothetical protein